MLPGRKYRKLSAKIWLIAAYTIVISHSAFPHSHYSFTSGNDQHSYMSGQSAQMSFSLFGFFLSVNPGDNHFSEYQKNNLFPIADYRVAFKHQELSLPDDCAGSNIIKYQFFHCSYTAENHCFICHPLRGSPALH